MARLLTLIIIIVFLQSIGHLQKHAPGTHALHNANNTAKDTSVKLSTFKTIPRDIDGCVLYLYQSKADEKKGVFLMVQNFAQEGYVSISGRLQHFNLTSYKDMRYYIYSNGVYILKLEITNKVDVGTEDFRVDGVLTLLKGHTILDTKDFTGEYAC